MFIYPCSSCVHLSECRIYTLQGSAPGEAEHYMGMAKETIEQLKSFAMDLRQQGQPNDNVVRTWGRPVFLSSSTDPYCHSIYLVLQRIAVGNWYTICNWSNALVYIWIGRMEMCKDQLKGVHKAITGSIHRRRSTRGSSGAWEETIVARSFQDAMAWIAQQKVCTCALKA